MKRLFTPFKSALSAFLQMWSDDTSFELNCFNPGSLIRLCFLNSVATIFLNSQEKLWRLQCCHNSGEVCKTVAADLAVFPTFISCGRRHVSGGGVCRAWTRSNLLTQSRRCAGRAESQRTSVSILVDPREETQEMERVDR